MRKRMVFHLLGILVSISLVFSTGCEKTQEKVGQRGETRHQQEMREVVKSGQLVIDEQSHRWVSNNIEIEMYLRNKGEYPVIGTLVFQVTLDGKGLDEPWIQQFIGRYYLLTKKQLRSSLAKILNEKEPREFTLEQLERGYQLSKEQNRSPNEEQELKNFIPSEEDIVWDDELELWGLFNEDEPKWSIRFPCILSYIDRGEKLPEGKDYEPISPEQDIYSFKFRKDVSLKSGELIHIKKEQPIPPSKEGLFFHLEIDGIEFPQTVGRSSSET